MIFFHLLNRGVDKRKIFMEEVDYFRFIHDLFEFNDISSSITHTVRRFNDNKNKNQLVDIGCRPVKEPRKLLVRIHAFCIMPNHYHLLVSPLAENSIPLFMKKLNMGYAKYFNEKYKRSGALFQGKYKAVPINSDNHFSYIPYYIHFNPLDLMPENGNWRERKVVDSRAALEFLENYRWSSHLDYLGKKNFPSITQREMLYGFFGGEAGYRKSLSETIKSFSIEETKGLLLE